MHVKFSKAFDGYEKGQVVDVDNERGNYWIKTGVATETKETTHFGTEKKVVEPVTEKKQPTPVSKNKSAGIKNKKK